MNEQDSFQNYKGELQKELGISDLKPPTKPMNAYMRYFLQRSSEERAKGQFNLNQLSATIAAEWNALPDNKKDYYQQIYGIRSRERDGLLVQYELLSNKKKVLTPYSRFIKKRYLQYSKQYKTLNSLELTKLANEDWKNLSTNQKENLKQQYEQEKNDIALGIDRSDQISEYLQNLQRYHATLDEDKNKILRKYGLSAQHKAQVKQFNKERKEETRQMIKDLREEIKKQQKKKHHESEKKKKKDEGLRIYKITQQQRDEEKFALRAERAKVKAEKAEIFRKEREEREIAKKAEKESTKAVKIEKEESVSKNKRSHLTKTKNINKKNGHQAVKSKTGNTLARATRSKK